MISQNIFKKRHNGQYFAAFIFLLILTSIFDLIILPGRFFICLGIILLLFFFITSRKDLYQTKLWLGILWLMIAGSIGYSCIVNNQSLIDVTIASYFAMGLSSFFVFRYFDISYNSSLKLIKYFSILFCLCYIVQMLVYPIPLFGGALDKFSINDDLFRMRMACSGCSYCLFFYGINVFMKTHKAKALIYSVLGFVPFIIMGFRSLIFLTIVLTIYMVVKYNQQNKKYIIAYVAVFCVLSTIAIQFPFVQYKMEEMASRQEEQTFKNEDYVRYIAFDYYSNCVYNTPAVRFFGGGVPLTSANNMNWSNEYVSLINKGYQYELYWNDLGLIGFGFIFGFPSVILISFLIFRTIFKCKEQELLFIRATLVTLYFASIFTSQELYRSGNFVFIGLLMYTEYKYHLSTLIKKQ